MRNNDRQKKYLEEIVASLSMSLWLKEQQIKGIKNPPVPSFADLAELKQRLTSHSVEMAEEGWVLGDEDRRIRKKVKAFNYLVLDSDSVGEGDDLKIVWYAHGFDTGYEMTHFVVNEGSTVESVSNYLYFVFYDGTYHETYPLWTFWKENAIIEMDYRTWNALIASDYFIDYTGSMVVGGVCELHEMMGCSLFPCCSEAQIYSFLQSYKADELYNTRKGKASMGFLVYKDQEYSFTALDIEGQRVIHLYNRDGQEWNDEILRFESK